MLQDIAVLTGGKLIAEELGIKLETVSLDDLGKARRVVLDKDSTTIIDGGGKNPPSKDAAMIFASRSPKSRRTMIVKKWKKGWPDLPAVLLSFASMR